MPCQFCTAVFEQADARYINHVLAGHPGASLLTSAALAGAFLAYRDDLVMLVVAGLTITAAAVVYRGWASS